MSQPLTVSEVIACLQKLPQEMPVYLWQNHDEPAWPLTQVSRIVEPDNEPDWILLQ